MKLFLSIISFFLCGSLFSQSISVTGLVQSENTGSFLADAIVSANNQKIKTDSTGAFRIQIPTQEKINFEIRLTAYKTFSQK